MAYLIGTDIGTSGTKTVLFDELGNTISSSTYEYEMLKPAIGWAEQDPNEWWRAVYQSINDVISQSGVPNSEIKGIGLSGQMHGAVMLDKHGDVLRNAIIWCDQRTTKECVEITEKVGKKRLIEITANPALTGFTASKILWIRNNEPAIYDKTDKILLPKDYIRYKLTGEFATEVSDGSGMQLMDITKRDWSDEVLEKLEIDKSLLGKMYESCEITGQITSEAAKLTKLKVGTIVAGGAGDQAALAVGNGIVRKGIVSSSIGTSGVMFAHADSIEIDLKGRVHTFCHAVPGAWHVMGVTQGAGLSLQWFRDQFCKDIISDADKKGIDPYIIMDQLAENIPIGSEGVIYLPYLMGERTPHLDPDAKGVFFGMSASHTRDHLIRAVLEGVIFSLKDSLEIMKDMGIQATEVRASGGGGKSPLWRQMQADVFNSDITTINSKEGGALGVAILAGVAKGIYPDVVSACDQIITVTNRQVSNASNQKQYEQYYQLYKKLYVSLKDDFKTVSSFLK
ncbi:MAG: xylulokinase [Clostridiales bacterium]|nr:xylulokinase [Clostridiales bacterium]